jgi:hypothetical protein
LTAITVQDAPSDSPIQAQDYKLFLSDCTKETADSKRGVTCLAPRASQRRLMAVMPSPQPNIGLGGWRQVGLRFWVSLVAAAVATGFAAGFLMRLLHWVQQLAWEKGTGDFLDAVERAGAAHRVVVVLGAGVLVVGTRWLLRLRGSGHGGELGAAIWFRAGHLPALRSIIIVGLGASLGRDIASGYRLGRICRGPS